MCFKILEGFYCIPVVSESSAAVEFWFWNEPSSTGCGAAAAREFRELICVCWL